jgi:hypothetical protein
LSENLAHPLQPIASWSMPPLKKDWPPAMSTDLSWLAFGDTVRVQEWNADSHAIRPVGMLRYDGRTGKQLASPKTPLAKRVALDFTTPHPVKVSATGNLLLVRPANQTGEPFDPSLLDAISGDKIDWPASIPEVGRISDIHVMKHDPSTVLVFQNVAVNLMDLAFFRARPDNPTIYRFHRDGNKWSLMNQITIGTPGAFFVMPNCISRDEIVVQTIADTAPPLIRELCEKYQWLAPHVEKLWPNQQPAIKIIDLSSGKCLKTIFEAYPSMPYQFNEPKHFFVTRMKKDDMTLTSLEAWKLPFASQTWSPWWSRTMGVLMFLLFIWLLSRRQSTTLSRS